MLVWTSGAANEPRRPCRGGNRL